MSFYGYDPSRFATPYMARGIEAAGKSFGEAVGKVPELALAYQNKLKNETLYEKLQEQLSSMDEQAFKAAGTTREMVLQRVAPSS